MNKNTFVNIPLDFSFDDNALSHENTIFFKKTISSLKQNIKDMQPTFCPICEKKITAFCKSHSLPRFCLKNISDDGNVTPPSFIWGNPIFEDKMGIAKTGTFYLICRECDQQSFSHYENLENYTKEPTKEMLAEIAMKNALRYCYKRISELSFYQNMLKQRWYIQDAPETISYALETTLRDFHDFQKDFKYAKKALANSINNGFNLNYYKLLDYTIPVAAQIEINLIFDLDGNVVNNIYKTDKSYNLQPIQICLFPLEKTSAIIIFSKEGDNRNRSFFKKFNKLSLDTQLHILSYLPFLYSEDVFINNKIEAELKINDKVKETISASSIGIGFAEDIKILSPFDKIQSLKESYNLMQYKEFPNLLSREFSIH